MWELHYVKELIDFMSLELNNEIESFLMIGQSNIAGRGEFGEVEAIENDDCFMLRMGIVGKRPKKMNQIFHEIAEEMEDCRVVTSQGLKLKSDGIHFDSESCRIFGQRYCEIYLAMQRSK